MQAPSHVPVMVRWMPNFRVSLTRATIKPERRRWAGRHMRRGRLCLEQFVGDNIYIKHEFPFARDSLLKLALLRK